MPLANVFVVAFYLCSQVVDGSKGGFGTRYSGSVPRVFTPGYYLHCTKLPGFSKTPNTALPPVDIWNTT